MFSIYNHLPKSIFKLHKDIIPQKAYQSWIYDIKNNSYLDFTSGIGALSTGHSHKLITNTIKNEIDNMVHIPQQVFGTHPAQIELTQKILEISPHHTLNNIFYLNSGSEATDNAIRIARRYTKKTNIIAINGGFHGRTMGALSVTSSNLNCKLHSQPLLPGIFFADYKNKHSIDDILNYQSSPTDTAAIILEPVLGEGGVFSIPTDFFNHIKDICNNNNIMIIADEVQCGSGRTGTWWNIEQKNIIPDLLTFGKGIASGFPMAGILSSNHIMNNIGNSYLGGTYGGNVVSSIVASKTIDIIKNEKLLNNTITQGNKIKQQLLEIDEIKSIRQYGLMIAFDFKEPYTSHKIIENMRQHQVLCLLCGNQNQYIRILPPLNVSNQDIDFFINALKKSIFNYNN